MSATHASRNPHLTPSPLPLGREREYPLALFAGRAIVFKVKRP